MTWRNQKIFAGALFLAIAWLQLSAWDEKDLAELRAKAERARADGVRYLVEQSQYRDAYVSEFHCRAPRKGEQLVMQHADPRDPGKGYRCTTRLLGWRNEGVATVTWSRSPEVVREFGAAR